MIFKSSPKIFRNYKSRDPKETYRKIDKFLEEINLKSKLEYEENKISRCGVSSYYGRISFKTGEKRSQLVIGKGLTSELCRSSAFGELIERLLTGFLPVSCILKESMFPLISKTNENKKAFPKIKKKEFLTFFPKFEHQKGKFESDWKEAISIIDEKKYRIPHSFMVRVSGTNGLAAGNTLEEAFVQAFFEIVERFSLIEHVTKKISAKSINIETIKNKKIIKFVNLFESLNFKIDIKDFTFNNRLPVMGVLFTNNNLKKSTKLIKAVHYRNIHLGAHFDLEEAIIRCFTEHIQGYNAIKEEIINPYSVFKFSSNVDILGEYFSEKESEKIISNFKKNKCFVPLFKRYEIMDDFRYLDCKKGIDFGLLKSKKTDDFLEDINLIKKIIFDNKWKAFFVDYTVKNSPLRVVRLVIPSVSEIMRFNFKNSVKNFYEKPFGKLENMSNREKFNFLKFIVFPETTLPYHPFSSKINCPEVAINQMLEISKIIDKKEFVKISNIAKKIPDFEKYSDGKI
jgi:YcaO-like protein with predicted kinase domain